MNVRIIIPIDTPTKPVKLVKIGPGDSEIFGVICITLKGVIVNSINSGVTGPNLTKIPHNTEIHAI